MAQGLVIDAGATVLLGLAHGDMAGEALNTWPSIPVKFKSDFGGESPRGRAPIVKGLGRLRV